jgi:hypothetical protein
MLLRFTGVAVPDSGRFSSGLVSNLRGKTQHISIVRLAYQTPASSTFL